MLEFHPSANLFPALWLTDKESYQKLCDDIASNGLLEPIWLHDGLIIDGRNRYMACRDVGVEPAFREWSGEGGSITQFVISLNMNRRHLNSSQRAMIAFHALPLLEAEAKERQRTAGGDRKSEEYQESVNQKIDEREQSKQSLDQAAEMAGTNRQYVSDIKAISKKAPELLPKIEAGTLTIPEAKRQMTEPQPQPKQQRPEIKWSVVGPMLKAALEQIRDAEDREAAIEMALRLLMEIGQEAA